MITVWLAPAGPSQTQLLHPMVKCHPHCSSKSFSPMENVPAKISASTGPLILLKNIEDSKELWFIWIISIGILRLEIKTEKLFKYLSGFIEGSWILVSAPAFYACIMWPLENSSVYSWEYGNKRKMLSCYFYESSSDPGRPPQGFPDHTLRTTTLF